MTQMRQRTTRGSRFTDCPIEPSCTSGHGPAGKRESTVTVATPRTATTTTHRTMPATMKRKQQTVTTRTVLLCCWCLLLVTTGSTGLPITSKPLDNNPDHLTWEAAWLSEDSRAPQPLTGGKSKKITPKSIFITPFLNNYNTSACPPDYKVDFNGKCIQVVSINTADILVTKLQSLFSQHGDNGSPGGAGEDDYDYDYDSTGPFQVNLPLSIDLAPEPPQPQIPQGGPKLTYQDIPGPSFYDSAMVDVATVEQDNGKITTVSVSATGASDKPFPATTVATSGGNGKEPVTATTTTTTATSSSSSSSSDQTVAESHTDISFLAFETLPNGTLAGQIELDGNNRTVVQSIFVSSTTTTTTSTERPTTTGDSTTEFTASTELDSRPGTTTDRTGEAADTDATVASSSMSITPDMSASTMTTVQGESTITTDRQDDTYPTESDHEKNVDASSTSTTTGSMATTTINSATTGQGDELDELKLELIDELLLMDNNRSTVASTPPDTLTTEDVSEMDLDTLPTSETQPVDEIPTLASHQEPSTTVKVRTISPTRAPVQIITPLRNSWLDYGNRGGGSLAPAHLVAASHIIQQDRTTRATPETTTVPYDRSTSGEPHQSMVRNDPAREEQNLRPISDTNDASNRFVYHPTEATASTSERDILQVRPLATTPASNNHNYLEQLRKINEIVAEKRRQQQQQEQQLTATGNGDGSTGSRIRFPSRDDEQLTGAASSNSYQQTMAASSSSAGGGGVRFPGSATNRLTANGNRLPDIFPKKSPDSTTQRPAFWWLPSGWEVDQTGNKPMLLRFWSRMPLVRDASQQGSANGVNENELSTGGTGTNSSNRWRSSTGFQSGNSLPAAATNTGSSRAVSSSSSSSHPVASARGNSKSPSENFYKEVSAQEVYKVMNARQLNHHQKR
uniref:Folded gastrulation N-terminal domain-containing protein n=1 Tax=Anopheles atroparvus TaxID=41427 RepID=A0AAG5DHF3_ANOAO